MEARIYKVHGAPAADAVNDHPTARHPHLARAIRTADVAGLAKFSHAASDAGAHDLARFAARCAVDVLGDYRAEPACETRRTDAAAFRPADRGTFAAWLGDRAAEYVPHRAAPQPSSVPAGCPRGLGEGDRTRRIWTDPSGVLAFGDMREYGAMLADDRARGYGRVLAGTSESCARSAGAALAALLPTSGVSDPGACRAARAARMARHETACAVCDSRGNDPHEPGIACAVCDSRGTCDPWRDAPRTHSRYATVPRATRATPATPAIRLGVPISAR